MRRWTHTLEVRFAEAFEVLIAVHVPVSEGNGHQSLYLSYQARASQILYRLNGNDVLEQQFIDIPAKYHDRRITLRLILNPNWNILFIAIQNDLQYR